MPPVRYIPDPSSSSSPLTKGLLLAGGLLLSYHLGKKLVAEWQRSGAEKQADDSLEVQQAMLLRMAMNPSGISWMRTFDTTQVDKVLEIGQNITNLDAVAKAYKDLYRDSLLADLQSELSSDQYQRFITLVSANPAKQQTSSGSSPTVQFAKPQVLIVAKKEVFIRSTPDASYHGSFYEQFSDKNILRTAKPGEFLGYATGIQSFDQKNNVKFIRVGFSVLGPAAPLEWKKRHQEKVSFWVSSSANYVEQFSSETAMQKAYPGTEFYTRWMKPIGYFESGMNGSSAIGLVSTGHLTVFDETLQPIGHASPNMLLGILEMEMRNGKDTYYRFLTENNLQRWVKSHQVKLLHP